MVSTDVACPPEQRIAAFLEGTLPAGERDALLGHVDTCARCFELVAALGNRDAWQLPEVDQTLQRAATRLVGRRPWLVRQLPALGAAAAVLLAIVWWREPPRTSAPAPLPHVEQSENTAADNSKRSIASEGVTVLEPRDGQAVASQVDVRWVAPSEAVAFEISVKSEGGDMLRQRRLPRTSRSAQVDVPLSSGEPCYLQVSAQMPDGRLLRSNLVKLNAVRR